MNKSPFFLASLLVHMGILYLVSLMLYEERLEKSKDMRIIDVEFIRSDTPSKDSIIEYHAEKPEEALIHTRSLKDTDESIPSTTMQEAVKEEIQTTSNIPERVITKEEKIKRDRSNEEGSSPSIISKIIYKEDYNPDIRKPTEGRLLAYLSPRDPIPANNATKSSPDIQKYSFFSKSDTSPIPSSEQDLKQDYELARLFIQEKANRFVPVVYQKRLLEKKKRTAIVELIMQKQGYVESYRILKSTGLAEMDKSIRAILHLAEPYIYVPVPVKIELIFLE